MEFSFACLGFILILFNISLFIFFKSYSYNKTYSKKYIYRTPYIKQLFYKITFIILPL